MVFIKGKPSWNTGIKAPQIAESKLGKKNPMWNGGIIIKNGYRLIKDLAHPLRDAKGYVKEHRIVMEQKLGRILDRKENVHHKNSDKLDNSIDNLELISLSEHMRQHRKKDVLLGKPLFGHV